MLTTRGSPMEPDDPCCVRYAYYLIEEEGAMITYSVGYIVGSLAT